MRTLEVFIFGWINFVILMALIFRASKKLARQYLYARRLNLKKEMVSSSNALRSTKIRLLKALEIANNIEKDIAERKRSGLRLIQKDCDGILDIAKKRAERITLSALKFVEGEKARTLLIMKRNIAARAIEKALMKLNEQISDDSKKLIIDSGVRDLKSSLKKFRNEIRAELIDV